MTGLGETIAQFITRRLHPGGNSNATKLLASPASNPGALEMFTFAPANLASSAPLVVVLHGCTQHAPDYAYGAGWLELAERYGFAVLAPGQTSANNPNRCFNWFLPSDTTRGHGEAASIAAMIAAAITQFHSDPARVFITGLSAGGAMTAVMLATYPELFAAGAVIGGLPYGAATSMAGAFAAMQGRSDSSEKAAAKLSRSMSHNGPWPGLMVWHGDADTTVHVSNGERVAHQWAAIHGLSEGPVERETLDGRKFAAWESKGRSVVEFHKIPKMGHGTPLKTSGRNSCGQAGPFLLDVGISSSVETARHWSITDELKTSPDSVGHKVLNPEIMEHCSRSGVSKLPPEPPPPAHGISAIIDDALRKAGLMKW